MITKSMGHGFAWQGAGPVVTLEESDARRVVLASRTDLLAQRPDNEERWYEVAVDSSVPAFASLIATDPRMRFTRTSQAATRASVS